MTKEDEIPDWVGAQEFYGKYDPKEILGRYGIICMSYGIVYMYMSKKNMKVFSINSLHRNSLAPGLFVLYTCNKLACQLNNVWQCIAMTI